MIYAQQKKDNQDKQEMNCPMMDKMRQDGNKAHKDCPMIKKQNQQSSETMDDHSKHANHQAMVMENGEKAMGFSQTATTHHFLLMKNGGAIQVEANDPSDKINRDAVRSHLIEIAKQFSAGIFTTPFAVHGQIPPGVPVMDELKKTSSINTKKQRTEQG